MKDDMGNPVNWKLGDIFATEILEGIQYVSEKEAPFKVETQGFQIYWAGGVLRIDIKKAEIQDWPERTGYVSGR